MRHGLLCGFAGLFALGATAHAQSFTQPRPPAGPSTPAAPDLAMEAAQKAFEALPENDRRAIQDALMWTGDYNAVVGVNFGKRFYDGLRAWQKRKNAPQTGVLTDSQWAALLAEGKRAKDSVRFATLDDPVTKIRMGIPLRVTEKRAPFTSGAFTGTVYQSNDGVLGLNVGSAPLSALPIEQAYADEIAAKPGRKVTYKLLRPDFFVASGEDKGRVFYTRGAKSGDQLRGFTFTFPAARKADFERVMLAVANSFEPFPTSTVATSGNQTGGTPPTPPPPARIVFAATGLIIAPGRVLTSAGVAAACVAPTVNGAPARVEGADSSGAIILAIQGGRAAALAVGRATDEDSVVALSATGGQPAQVASGTLRASGGAILLAAGLAGGAMGAPVFNRQGALVGIVAGAPKPVAVASLGAPPAVNHRIAPAERFAALLPASPAAADTLSAGAIAAKIAPSVVMIGCAQ